MKQGTLIFLDFDGVLCDSLPETLASSWLAFHQFVLEDSPSHMPADFRKRFLPLRPFIRTGEDYLVLQEALFRNTPIRNQDDFDRLKNEAGAEKMTYYKNIFYQARQDLLDRDPDFWLSLNPIFPALKKELLKKPRNQCLFILSTKRKKFILEILAAHGIVFIEENVIDSGRKNKAGIIGSILARTGGENAVFIDDQIDHLKGISDIRIKPFLAAWGYVKGDWLVGLAKHVWPANESSVSLLTIEEASAMIQSVKKDCFFP